MVFPHEALRRRRRVMADDKSRTSGWRIALNLVGGIFGLLVFVAEDVTTASAVVPHPRMKPSFS
jgi:hypothetical protein